MATLLPNTLYQVRYTRMLTSLEKESLSTLYQPLIGADALALYFILLGDGQTKKEHTHLDLLQLLPVGMTKFLEARTKLEGLGLLGVFQKNTETFGWVYGYELMLPLTPERFFSDATYSFLLESTIGERRFQELLARYTPKKIVWEGFEEVTKQFSDVYRLDFTRFGQEMEHFEELATRFEPTEAPLVLPETLDWSFLAFHAKKKQIHPDNFTEAFKKQLLLLHQLYGYDELELVDLMTHVVSLQDGMVDGDELKKFVQKQQSLAQKQPQKDPEVVMDEQKRVAALAQAGFSEIDIAVIRECEQYPPYEYFSAIKHEKKSYISKLEEWLVRDLVERSRLNNSVINILLHYVLVVKNNSTLPQKLVEKLAADWSEKEVRRPEDAVQIVRDLDKESKQAKETRAKSTYSRPVKTEVLPKWLTEQEKSGPSNESDAVTQQEQAALEARLQAYLKRKEGEH